MADLQDGETIEMQGSAAKPYVLKNTGGVYSCSCPAWRNQSIAIEQRTCKHLRKLRGDAAEEARIGGTLPQRPVRAKAAGAEGVPSANAQLKRAKSEIERARALSAKNDNDEAESMLRRAAADAQLAIALAREAQAHEQALSQARSTE